MSGKDASSRDGAGAKSALLAAGDEPSAHGGQANGAANAAEHIAAATHLAPATAQQNGTVPEVAHLAAILDDTAAGDSELAAVGASDTDMRATPQQPDDVACARQDAACSRAPLEDSDAASGAGVTAHVQRAQQPAGAAGSSGEAQQEHTDPLRAPTPANAAAAEPLQQPSHKRAGEAGSEGAERLAGLSLGDGAPLHTASPASAEEPGEQRLDMAGLGAHASGDAPAAEPAPRHSQQRGAEPSGEASGGHAAEPALGARQQRGAEASDEASGGRTAEPAPEANQRRGAETLNPKPSGELPVSTLRVGRCFSGYVSAEEDLPGSCPPDNEAASPQLPGPAGCDGGAPQRAAGSGAGPRRHPSACDAGSQGGTTSEPMPGSFSAWTAGAAEGGSRVLPSGAGDDEELQDLSLRAIRRAAAAEGSSCEEADEEASSSSGLQAPEGGRELRGLGDVDAHAAHSARGSILGGGPPADDGASGSSPVLDSESEYGVAAPSDDTSQSGAAEGAPAR